MLDQAVAGNDGCPFDAHERRITSLERNRGSSSARWHAGVNS